MDDQNDLTPAGANVNTWMKRWLASGPVRTLLGLAVLAGIVGGLILLDRGGGRDTDLGPLDDGNPRVGELAPDFELMDTEGNVVRLSDYRGRAVWLNFWATWCGPCRRELPDIELLASEFGEEALVVFAINQEESELTAEDFWEELDLTLTILLDSSGEVSDQYRLVGLPNNFFIDSDGVIRSFQLGFLVEEQMRDSLAKAGVS